MRRSHVGRRQNETVGLCQHEFSSLASVMPAMETLNRGSSRNRA